MGFLRFTLTFGNQMPPVKPNLEVNMTYIGCLDKRPLYPVLLSHHHVLATWAPSYHTDVRRGFSQHLFARVLLACAGRRGWDVREQ